MNTTDHLTDAQVLRWLKAKADELAAELKEPKLSLHIHAHSSTLPPYATTIRLMPEYEDDYKGRTLEEAVAAYLNDRSPEALRARAAVKRAEADRLEREAAQ